MRGVRVVLVVVTGLAAAGCSNADEPAVRAAASSFAGADAQTRCGLLAPATLESLATDGPCADVLGELPLGSGAVDSVQVWGEEALVHLSDDTLFLTWDDGWLVSAAACTPGGEGSYECQLEGA